jgi:hypothetical protein
VQTGFKRDTLDTQRKRWCIQNVGIQLGTLEGDFWKSKRGLGVGIVVGVDHLENLQIHDFPNHLPK